MEGETQQTLQVKLNIKIQQEVFTPLHSSDQVMKTIPPQSFEVRGTFIDI